jgi:mRNA-degrading endonuclease RelE of RelBE toxin-antitoxin system
LLPDLVHDDALSGTEPVYTIEWSEHATSELQALRSFYRPPIVAATAELVHQAETETRNRKPLSRADQLPPEYPDPTWEIRVGAHRVFYSVEGETVRILGVKLKGTRTTGEIL